MSHCKDPSKCSQCLGATVRRVQIVSGETKVDGVTTPVANPWDKYRKRGGRATAQRSGVQPRGPRLR